MTEINTANLTCNALRILIHKLQTKVGIPTTNTSKVRKAELIEIANALQAELNEDGPRDESVNETVDGAQVATRWLNEVTEDMRHETPEQFANRLAEVPSPLREYQSSREALAVLNEYLNKQCLGCNQNSAPMQSDDWEAELLASNPHQVDVDSDPTANATAEPAVFPGDHRDGCECADCEEFYADEPPAGFDPMANATAEEWDTYDATVDPQFAAEVDSLVARDLAADPPPARVYEAAPITETDVAAADVDVVVQLKSRLYNGKLIAVVNRRTRYCQPILATVEVGGVRFLVNADDMLAA